MFKYFINKLEYFTFYTYLVNFMCNFMDLRSKINKLYSLEKN